MSTENDDDDSKGTVTISLAIPQGTLEEAARRLGTDTARDTATAAVGANLAGLVAGLVALGFVASPLPDGKLPKRRPRKIDRPVWEALRTASEQTGLPASELLRAALVMAGRAADRPTRAKTTKR